MHTILLSPSDVLFFRDGRPMGGALAGHTAAWPLPTVTNAALHAALWRAGFAERVHSHRRTRSGKFVSVDREKHGERFGSLVTAGPFPVSSNGAAHASTWYFPRPLDAVAADDFRPRIALQPTFSTCNAESSTQRCHGLAFTAASTMPPGKAKQATWWSEGAWNHYLGAAARAPLTGLADFKHDSQFADTEASLGIGIDPARGTQDGTRIYSAHYLRLREGWRLGLLARAEDKDFPEYRSPDGRGDLLRGLFAGGNQHLVIGGQQRVCSAQLLPPNGIRFPLPLGKSDGFAPATIGGQTRHLLKWVLLAPAVFPEIAAGVSARGTAVNFHPGGWLPSWIEPRTHRVLLRTVPPEERRARRRDNADGRGYDSARAAAEIAATLVAALVPKPIPVTGWSLGDERFDETGVPLASPGAKPVHLAVPAGAVYYFSCDSAADACALAAALNWHGDTPGTVIRNRRSTLLGEKGFGLGVCGTWQFHGTT